jgi:hypothetical protein
MASVAQFGLIGLAVNPPVATLQHILTGGSDTISRLRPVGVVSSDFNARFGGTPQIDLPSGPVTQPSLERTTEDRLRDLMRLRNLGLINASEYDTRRNSILSGL